jgi:hypothetical protein
MIALIGAHGYPVLALQTLLAQSLQISTPQDTINRLYRHGTIDSSLEGQFDQLQNIRRNAGKD